MAGVNGRGCQERVLIGLMQQWLKGRYRLVLEGPAERKLFYPGLL